MKRESGLRSMSLSSIRIALLEGAEISQPDLSAARLVYDADGYCLGRVTAPVFRDLHGEVQRVRRKRGMCHVAKKTTMGDEE